MFDWVIANWGEVMATLAVGILLAQKITALTPTKTDDEMVAKVAAMLTSFGFKK